MSAAPRNAHILWRPVPKPGPRSPSRIPAAPPSIRAVGTSLGAWGTFTAVYALDFDSVSTAGTYTISVASPIAATSPAFKIDTGANLYATPLANSLFYYETSRDGPNYIPNALRTAPGHLNDESAKVYFTPTLTKRTMQAL